VQLTTSEERDVRTPDIVNAWRQASPDVAGVTRFTIAQARGGPPGRDIEVRLQGQRVATSRPRPPMSSRCSRLSMASPGLMTICPGANPNW
jgi:hypothetical protein